MDSEGRWRLSPAYDLGYAYNPDGGWTSMHQMSINGKFDSITRADLLEFAAANNIKEASAIIDEVVDRIAEWPQIAADAGVPQEMAQRIMKNMIVL